MNWFSLIHRLRVRGILGMNARNAGAVARFNPRALFSLVDDKLQFLDMCRRIGVPVPAVFAVFTRHGDLRFLGDALSTHPDCVIKPARGSSGRGILLLTGPSGSEFIRHSGAIVDLDFLRRHVSDTLSGLFSLGGRPDRAIVQQRLRTHPTFERISYRGTPDVRILVYRGEPAMAMLRLPTLESAGRANLHQGGVGVGIDLELGQTTRAIWHGRAVNRHPDTGELLADREIPAWPAIVHSARIVARATGLGYVGVDVVPTVSGPVVLEANARPGLAIQMANGLGLAAALRRIDFKLMSDEQ